MNITTVITTLNRREHFPCITSGTNIALRRQVIAACLALTTVIFLATGEARADTRHEASQAVAKLRNSGAMTLYPDEILNIGSSLALADKYFQSGDLQYAEIYYRYSIQQAQVIEAMYYNAPSSPYPLHSITDSPHQDLPEDDTDELQPQDSGANSAMTWYKDIPNEIVSEKLVGDINRYTVVRGDTLRLVAAKLGVSRNHLITINHLNAKTALKVDQQLRYNNRKIIPKRLREGIIVNIPDKTLYYFQKGKLVRWLPVALGISAKDEKHVWQTPTGKFRITDKVKDPTWHVPPSIKSEMEDEGKDVIATVPPGARNPLGKYAIKTSIPGILIHSTTKPSSIYGFTSHGCIRVYPDHMEKFFREVKVKTFGEIIYKPVKLAVTDGGRVFLEVHQDIYKKNIKLASEARRLIEQGNVADKIDWGKFESVVKQKSGIAEEITM